MSVNLPTTQQIIDQNKSNFENRIGQTTPSSDRAFTTVVSVVEGLAYTSLKKYGADRFLAALASTAQGSDLDIIGNEYGVYRNQAVAEQITITVTGTNGTLIPSGTVLIGAPNNAIYQSTADATIASGTATVSATAQVPGIVSNLNIGDTVNLQSSIIGVSAAPTVASIVVTGADTETDDDYRIPVLAKVRSVGGGCNASDYQRWAISVAGIVNAYPYSGLPYVAYGSTGNPFAAQYIQIVGGPTGGTFKLQFNGTVTGDLAYNCAASDIQTALRLISGSSAVNVTVLGSGFIVTGFTVWAPILLNTNALTGGTNAYVLVQPNEPPARTVYAECDSTIQPDGIPTSGLLTQVTDAITTNASGKSQQSLGLTNNNLFVMPITRTKFYVQITSLSVPSGQVSACQTAITAALTTYFLSIAPYVDGITPDFSRNDLITNPSVGRIVQSVLIQYGASCASVAFGTTSGTWLSSYQIAPGEKSGLVSGGVTYV